MQKLTMTYDGNSKVTIRTNLPVKIVTYAPYGNLTRIVFSYRTGIKWLEDLETLVEIETLPAEIQWFLEDLGIESLAFRTFEGDVYMHALVFNGDIVYDIDIKEDGDSKNGAPMKSLSLHYNLENQNLKCC